MIEATVGANKRVYGVWKLMEIGGQKSFSKIYNIKSNTPNESLIGVLGFKKSGEPIIEMKIDKEEGEFFVYEPNSKQIN